MNESSNHQAVYLLNVLWFKPDGGESLYREYLRQARDIVARYGGRKLDSYVPEEAVIGTWDADLVFFVQWPDWKTFQAFIADPDFQAIRHLRESALERSLLIRCRKVG